MQKRVDILVKSLEKENMTGKGRFMQDHTGRAFDKRRTYAGSKSASRNNQAVLNNVAGSDDEDMAMGDREEVGPNQANGNLS